MQPRQVRTARDVRAIVEERKLTHVKVGVFDIDGIMRGKYMSRAKFLSALDNGFGFCDVVLGWDSNDQLYDNVKYTGWHTGYPDAPVRILPGELSAAAVGGGWPVLPLRVFSARRCDLPARDYCAVCSSARRVDGIQGLRRDSNTNSSSSTKRPSRCAPRTIATCSRWRQDSSATR